MRTIWRTAGRALIRDIAALAGAVGLVGLSFGAIATAAHLPLWAVVAMSTLVFAGGSQFMAAGLVAAGNPVAAVLAGLLLNARHLPFGMAVADVLGRGPARLLGSHLMADESVAFALAQQDPARRRAAYWLTGTGLFVTWNVGAVAGALLGAAAGDPATFGLDAAFPAGLLALLLPGLRAPRREDSAAPWVAGAGALVAVLATPLVPAGAPVLLALVALGLTFVVPARKAAVNGAGPRAGATPC
jgi:predicted branched-subunit amino acid permease